LFAFDAMSLNGPDFLSLISGATFDELEARLEIRRELGRINYLKRIRQNSLAIVPFFYDHDERYFLEVLYLKLSFLGEVFQRLLQGTDLFKHPDLRLSIDRIWIKLEDHGGSLLPFFWNFRVGFLDMSRHLTEIESLPTSPPSFTLFFLASVWFYTLLGNKKQDISSISHSLRESFDRSFSDQNFSNPFFNPSNIFWDPEGKHVTESWLPLWEKALHLGWSLFKVSFQYDSKWSKEEFWKQLDHLRGEVKNSFFGKEPMDSLPIRHSERIGENEAIYGILMGILRKWQAEKEEEKEVKEMIPETIILTPPKADLGLEERGTVKEVDKISSPRKTVELPQGDDFLAETVILGPGKAGGKGKDGTKR